MNQPIKTIWIIGTRCTMSKNQFISMEDTFPQFPYSMNVLGLKWSYTRHMCAA